MVVYEYCYFCFLKPVTYRGDMYVDCTLQVIATVCVSTRPAITLAEAMSQEQLERLILLASNLEFSYGNISWGGPWAGHAITCLLQDILDGKHMV